MYIVRQHVDDLRAAPLTSALSIGNEARILELIHVRLTPHEQEQDNFVRLVSFKADTDQPRVMGRSDQCW